MNSITTADDLIIVMKPPSKPKRVGFGELPDW